jgi:hypothetical protein
MTAIEARVEVLGAAIRAIAVAMPPEHAAAATNTFLRIVEPLGCRRLSDAADQAASAEVVSVMMALAR